MKASLQSRRRRLGDFAGLLAAVFALSVAKRANCDEFFWLDAKRLDQLLAAAGVGHSYPGVGRNQAGTKLLLAAATNRDTLLIIISEHGRQVRVLSGVPSAVSEDGRPICSVINGTLAFATGQRIPLAPGGRSRWGFSPGKTHFFFLPEFPAAGGVFLTAEPLAPIITLPPAFLPQDMFTRTNEVFVFGTKYDGGNPPGKATGLVYSMSKPASGLVREIDLSRFGGVLDMDNDSGLLLVEGKRDMFNTWGLYDVEARKYKSLGLMKGYGFFLAPGFKDYLERLCKGKAPAATSKHKGFGS
jgi:hypothetical protein